jgi:TPR repeat protein
MITAPVHPDPARVAEVLVTLPSDAGVGRRGSGYLVAGGLVLSAAHVVEGESAVVVRFNADRPSQWSSSAVVAWCDVSADLVLLRLAHVPPETAVAGVSVGWVRPHAVQVDAVAIGFPRWKLRDDPARGVFRDVCQADGTVAASANLKEGTLEFLVDPPGEDPNPAVSPWEAMSGAALWIDGFLVGVVKAHYRSEGVGRLTATRLGSYLRHPDPDESRDALASLLGVANRRTGVVDVLAMGTRGGIAPPVRSAYLGQVHRIAPTELLGRQQELSELAAFCTSPDQGPYTWWQGAPWAGKSALMSWFALHPPPGVQILSFFITARFAAQSDLSAFVEVMLEQAADALGESMHSGLTEATREAHLLEMLDRLAAMCHQDGKRLVLVVDGLDEDRGSADPVEGHSIAASLPLRPPAGMRIVVASRPHPPMPPDVPDDHPLHDPGIAHTLAPSEHAAVIRSAMHRELMRLLRGSGYERDLLGLVTAAGGGLSGPDLAELTNSEPWQIEEYLGAVAGRSFARHASPWQPRDAGNEVYVLGHEDLQAVAQQLLGTERLEDYRGQLHAWADRYRNLSWPDSTPEYLFRGYYRMLRDIQDLPRMVLCATDQIRHDRMLDLSGGDAAALAEITIVQDVSCRLDNLDCRQMALVALHRDLIFQRNASLPTSLPAVWALLRQRNRAEALIDAIKDPERKTAAVVALVHALADIGEFDEAERLASSIDKLWERANALDHIVAAVVAGGDIDRAENLARTAFPVEYSDSRSDLPPIDYGDRALARLVDEVAAIGNFARAEILADSIPSLGQRVMALADLVKRLMSAGHIERARAVALRAQASSKAEGPEDWPYGVRVGRVAAMAATCDFDQAEVLARAMPDAKDRDGAVGSLVDAVAAAGDLERAENLARSLAGNSSQWALASVAVAAARAGDVDRAERLTRYMGPWPFHYTLPKVVEALATAGDFDRAETLAHTLTETERHDWRKDYLIEALTMSAQVAARSQKFDRIDSIVSSIGNTIGQAYTLTMVAHTLAGIGEAERARLLAVRAETLARSVESVAWRNQALAAISRGLATAGNMELAEGLGRCITDRKRQVDALVLVVKSMVTEGDLGGAERLARSVGNATRTDYRGMALAPVAEARASVGDLEYAETLVFDIRSLNSQLGPIIQLIEALASKGHFARAEYLASRVVRENWQDPLVALVRGAASTDLHYAEMVARSIPDRYWKAQAICHLTTLRASADDDDERISSLRDEVEELIGPTIGQPDEKWLWDEHAHTAGGLGNLKGQIPEQYRQGHAMIEFSRALAKTGDFHRAEEVARSISDPAQRGTMMAEIVRAGAGKGSFPATYRLTEAMSILPRWQVLALAGLADEVFNTDPGGARAYCAEAEAVSCSIDSTADRAEAAARLMATMAAIGEVEGTERLANAIVDHDRRAEAFIAAAAAADQDLAQHLVALAFRAGSWAAAIPGLALVQPETLPGIAADFAESVTPPAEPVTARCNFPDEAFSPVPISSETTITDGTIQHEITFNGSTRRATEADDAATMFNRGRASERADDIETAIHWYEQAANAGHTDAMFHLGYHHRDNLPLSRFWYGRGAIAGLPAAMFNLAKTFEATDPASALYWYRRAADAGSVEAMNNLGVMEIESNPDGARRWFERSARLGHADGMRNLGVSLRDTDLSQALSWLEQAADAGDTQAMYYRALFSEEAEADDSRQWYQRAAEAGHIHAAHTLATLLHEIKPDEARLWCERAAVAGDVPSMFNLGVMLQDTNPADAQRWWRRAAECGHTDAMVGLGQMIADSDPASARTWYERSAAAGNDKAMYALGQLLEDLDLDEARTWYLRSAERGNTLAMRMLGLSRYQARDLAEAGAWWQRAADAGDSTAAYCFGLMLEEIDDVEGARIWYLRAASAGHEQAQQALGRHASTDESGAE